MITPAVLISASGTMVLSTSNRLGRVVDRIRMLAAEAEKPLEENADTLVLEKRRLIVEQVTALTNRLGLLQTAIVTLYTAIGLLVGSSITIGISATANGALSWVPVCFGLLGASALFISAATLVREARLAIRTTNHELDYIRKAVDHKFGITPERRT
jgi:hypothetical protein